MGLLRGLAAGAAAGAAGTTALNAVTYLDMVLRGRPTSDTPEQTVEKLAEKVQVDIPGRGDERRNRISGLGPLLGIAAGVGTGALVGLSRAAGWRSNTVLTGVLAGAAAMAGADVPMAVLGVSDPRTWGPKDWAADAVPHLAYGLLTALVLERLDGLSD